MRGGWFDTFRSYALSLILHAIVLGILLISLDFNVTPAPSPPGQDQEIIDAVAVDEQAVQQELERIKERERAKEQAEKERLEAMKEAERQAEELRKQREAEEQRLRELQQQKEAERERRELEEQRLSQLKEQQQKLEQERKEAERKLQEEKEAERRRQEELERQRKAEEERLAEIERRKEEERKRLEEIERQKEEERKRKEEEARKQREAKERARAEELLQEQMAAEEAARTKQRSQEDEDLRNRFIGMIKRQIESNFNKQGLPSGLEAKIRVRLAPTGNVLDVAIINSSGNGLFDQRALVAVQKSSPLRVPDDAEVFKRLSFGQFDITFRPQD